MKRILFVTSSIGMGGNEKVLLNILKKIPKDQLELHLLVLDGNIPENTIPKNIKSCDLGANYKLVSMGFKTGVKQAIFKGKLNLLVSLLREKFIDITTGKKNYYLNFWDAHKCVIESVKEHYDVAISFGLGIQVPVTVDKIDASTKIAWVNNDCSQCLEPTEINRIRAYYSAFNKIVTVTPAADQGYKKTFGSDFSQTIIIKDLFDEAEIIEKADMESSPYVGIDVPVIATVGRISTQKGYFLLLDTAKCLMDLGYRFSWKVIGNGDASEYIQKRQELNLDEYVDFVGAKSNPYPYIKNCDIYVQTSLWEGNCLTLIEAMLLERPIVTTDFPSAIEKISDGINGLIAAMKPEDLSEKISLILNNKSLCSQFSQELHVNRISNDSELLKIIRLLEEED